MRQKYKIKLVAALLLSVGLLCGWATPAGAIASCPTDPLSALTPYDGNYNDANAINVGVKFKVGGSPNVQGVKFYKGVDNTGTHVAYLRDVTTSTNLTSATFSGESSSGWQTVNFSSAVDVDSAHTYIVWVSMPNGHYAADGGGGGGTNDFSSHGFGGFSDPVRIEQGSNGVYSYTSTDSTVPSNTSTANYWVSPVVNDSTAPDNNTGFSASDDAAGPTLTWSGAGQDTNGVTSTGQPARTTLTRTSTEEGTVTIAQQSGGFSSWLDGPNDVTALPGRSYTYALKNTDGCGNVSTGTTSNLTPASQTLDRAFTSTPSSTDTGQTTGVTVGLRWNADTDGKVWGVRFYRAADTAPNIGAYFRVGLWDNDGTLLATTLVPTGNTQSGWVDVRFAEPVEVSASHDYVAGYYTPNGLETYTNGALSSAVKQGSHVTAVADSSGTPNGVYNATSGFAFPSTRSGNATWYGVDVDFFPL